VYDNITNIIEYRRQYEHIFDMKDDTNLSFLSSVTIDVKTTARHNSLLDNTINSLIANKVPEATGLSVTELLDLPADMFRSIIYAVKNLGMQEKEVLDELARGAKGK
jgi:hypothetical protein